MPVHDINSPDPLEVVWAIREKTVGMRSKFAISPGGLDADGGIALAASHWDAIGVNEGFSKWITSSPIQALSFPCRPLIM